MRRKSFEVDPCFNPADYGDGAASIYDLLYPNVESGLTACLAGLARGGIALDLGIGTGRVAIPLRRFGVEVHGIEASAAMIAALRARAEGAAIPVVHGDFSRDALGRSPYALIYSLVSTLFLLPSLALQESCLENIARHLAPDGVFVSEAYSDGATSPEPRSTSIPFVTPGGVVPYRVTTLIPPLGLFDEMAARAGLRLVDRWSNWARAPYDRTGQRHISVFARADGGRHGALADAPVAP
jgi:SAM-dependent methyltransferase